MEKIAKPKKLTHGGTTVVENTKKVHHYVLRAYLKQWAEDGRIFCLRDGRVFHSGLTRVACERFFYQLEDLSTDEVKLIERGLIEHTSEPLRNLLKNFVALHSLAPALRKQVSGNANPVFVSALDKMIANSAEDYHQAIEDSLLFFLRRMLAGQTDFYSDDQKAAEFIYALCMQFTRTKQVREAAVAQLGTELHGCNIRRVTGVLSYLVAMVLGCKLYGIRAQYKLRVIDNTTDTPFITADQPVINLQVVRKGDPVDKVEFFYPISPTKAMLLLEVANKRADSPLTAVSVNHYNMLMAHTANRYSRIRRST